MSVWGVSLGLVCLAYSLMYVEAYELPPVVILDNGTIVEPTWGKANHRGEFRVTCEKGYTIHPQNFTMCLPVCVRGCPNGYCKSPGMCGCLRNYVSLQGECKPTCASRTGSCAYGECVKGICVNCMPGYNTSSNGLYCEPQCGNLCDPVTQICTAPNSCSCREGYTWRNSSCEPVCERDCLHGTCVEPGKCECHDGRPPKDGICQASCWMDCTNGICIRDNVCKCLKGYILALPSLSCIEKCEGCENGICLAPNQCQCNEGYKWSKSEKRCKPKCFDCDRGGMECNSPNYCRCLDGWREVHRYPRVECVKKG